ncbi:hypothetical protein [Fibrobacter sp. UWB13]|uniref:hypothetical protein n=1 Tax=Fibrobacter sp. UWB13 TaxID=1896204 RepID=UPI000A0B371A|nr:hypothetical protein [Fibrobacter sp. UWB13]SMG25636.1 hypothetical protein SAMN05720489_1810 [Fibrobacter sp. UWB13]
MPAPLIIALAAPVVADVVNRLRKTKIKIAILGSEESGKSTFIELLQNGVVKKKDYRYTGLRASVPEFEAFWTKKNKFLRTDLAVNTAAGAWEKFKDLFPDFGNLNKNQGQDIPGGTELMNRYSSLMKGKNVVFFLINVEKFLTNESERKDVLARLEFIYNNRDDEGNFIVLVTHIDKVKEDETQIRSQLKMFLKDKMYSRIFEETKFLNLLDEHAGDEIRKCFRKYGNN